MIKKKGNRPAPKHVEEEEEEEQETTRSSRKSSNRSSLASTFDKAKPTGFIKDGKYTALIIDIGFNKPNDKGESAFVRYEIADEGEFQGQEIVQFYSLRDGDGNEMKGCGYLKRDLAVLDYGDATFAELQEVFDEIKENMPGVNITIKNNPPYTNAYLGGLNDDDIIDDWKQNRPDKPY